ncbi:hypothetical protein A3C20_02450 [Candidatus Kaiserbacteria bacterium RIFCSPHIGHO2_02_FULL_55_25]|uniref:CMP/dCMP-type deaminase domain-containing protein n=2 Tax=Parcubacteria group TaxID=1794811 RepID=A0A1F4Y0S4_9BACT|nr:MAG: hypothetical protein A3B33_02445 [Candidatus Adlerbacteria bacterium RIFCSPLOWO2_01_FULL_54_16]OGG53298.1 MAG: hypothetical protein A2764_02995 [Candidatus Kaiserbacteria bacterium RIFCSPHIGHO2_01_FULL_55_79]OGG69847.1 MAG: hypothetical protein A3C20_02450 [Candidatus Kaiserbacteria bacterium RIFCSPHIGHO2_02_FULL_55_25]OGG77446.1 MAG: hypothetical protein A3F56_02240 [Candidatus Kaiserbacteria bacterium RIFCSPHIGHO2_12_FULL_55_13]
MIVAQGLVEAPVLDALFKLTARPRPEDALRALREVDVQDAVLAAAQRMRHLAIEEDDARKERGQPLINYRRFYVGGVGIGVVLGRRYSTPYEWWVFAASNTKPSKKADKYCAEMRIIRAAKEVRCSCIGGIGVLGENQPDGRSGNLRKTLDPCGGCRDCMRHVGNRYLFRARTLIMTAQPLSQVRYVETLPKMMAAHGEKWP